MAAPGGSSRVVYVMYFVGFLDLFAVSLTIPLISKHARDLGASPTVVGLIGSIYGGMQLFASPLVGKWSDISGRRFVLLWCLLLSAGGYALLGVSTTILLLFLSRIPPGIFKHSQELVRAVITDNTPTSQHAAVFGRLNSMAQFGFIFGPMFGGHIAELQGGFQLCALTTTAIFVLQIVLVWLMVPKSILTEVQAKKDDSLSKDAPSQTENNEEQGGHQKSAGRGVHPLAFLRSFSEIDWTNLWDVFLVRFLMGFAILVYRSNFGMMLSYKYNASPVTTGYVTSYTAIVGTVSGFFVGRIASYYNNDAKLLLHMAVLQCVMLIGLAISPSIAMLVLCLTPLSLANSVARVASTNLTIERGHGHEVGALMGLGASTLSMARMLSPAIGGLAQEVMVSGPPVVGATFAGAGMMVLALFSQKKEKAQLIHQKIIKVKTS